MKGQRITLNREIFFKAHISEAEMYRNKWKLTRWLQQWIWTGIRKNQRTEK